MAIEKVELMHECSLEHLRMCTEKFEQDKKTGEEGNKRRMEVEMQWAGKKVPSA